jgi:hypothetical protein
VGSPWPALDCRHARENGPERSGLSAARPDLPQKVISAPAGDKVSGKSATLFGYVFAATTCEAFGAEHYFAGYRIKRPKELDSAIWTPAVGHVVEDAHESSGAATLGRRHFS